MEILVDEVPDAIAVARLGDKVVQSPVSLVVEKALTGEVELR